MELRDRLRQGLVIPAHPLALTAERKLDERRQRALTRYYRDAGAGGVAVAVHTTQFAIRERGLLRPVLELAAQEATDLVKVAGVCGSLPQTIQEATLARELGYDAVLLRLPTGSIDGLLAHSREIARILPVFGFYLQPAVGGHVLPYEFWRRFAEIENVVAIKIAPFNRYQTLDVQRAVEDAGTGVVLYTGNDDNILLDLVSGCTGGLLGHWSVWTRRAVEQLAQARAIGDGDVPRSWIRLNREVTDANAAFFDVANQFHGCIAGLHEVLRRQGLLAGRWCLDPNEDLSPGQLDEIDRVYRTYPHLHDDDFVREHLHRWLA
ncbi:MAG: dihydrodipicolinate synthase family protein [Bryobacteraceae bacterium]|nr:dihydrodipicolinate synthase family protein [Bryobacteraceae bacterium]